MKFSVRGALAALALTALAAPAVAADLPARNTAPVFTQTDTSWSPWQIRVRALGVLPDSSGKIYDTNGTLLRAGQQIPNAGVKASDSVVPELDISYFFTKNIAVEAICCVTPHDVKGTGILSGLDIGRTLLFPPTVLLQYHFVELGALQPYVGVGVNYTHFFGLKTGGNSIVDPLIPAGTDSVTALKIKDSVGLALQAGLDYMIDRHWGINVDVKKVWIDPNANAVVTNKQGAVLTNVPVNAKVKIDPWLVGAGVTYRF